MKIKCDVCKKEFNYPFKTDTHRHKEYELDGVPSNFWTTIDYLNQIEIKRDNRFKGIFKYLKTFPFDCIKKSLNEGNTNLVMYEKNIYLKDETTNPTGSFKDRGMPLLMNEVIKQKKKKIAIVSTGNAAISVVKYAKLYDLATVIFVPKNLSNEKRNLLKDASEIMYCKDIVDSFVKFSKYCRKNDDVFNGYLSTNISYLFGLETLYYELYFQLNGKVDNIILPCASGGNVLAGCLAFENLFLKNFIKRMPKFYIVQILGGNPIEQGYKQKEFKNLFVIDNPIESESILSNDTCFNYFKIIDYMRKGYIETISITEEELINYQSSKYDYNSCCVFSGLNKIKNNLNENENVVLIMTAVNRRN